MLSITVLRAELGTYPLNTKKRRDNEMTIRSKEHAKKEVANHSRQSCVGKSNERASWNRESME